MAALQEIEMFAGLGPDGQPIVEKLSARELDSGNLQLVRSPAFVKGVASGDLLKCDPETKDVTLVQRSGNLSVRVFSRAHIVAIAEQLTVALEQLGGELDLQNERMLVYSIHVSCGFETIEKLLTEALASKPDSGWLYGNVYDPTDGTTPLNWWQSMLAPE
ncbi:DUF4265 domain-containing protein [Marinimicrobium sp. ABcell2]|uniref:DUF4265 domain-containing protein n=1 Tax=Marinimicrobium sp. ABcell2 TaxID=3069751 RepID=UPI0027AEEA46|nr:DUF4265 domain-containing protein [Marinimicrobium sp. ABcell2]MDQ2076950.1 DUF4265 domain-containing protein [Marinimicrobium sp. ABcell2]